MLRINKQTDYAVRVILALASQEPKTRLSTASIQKKMLIPQSFLPRIVAQLANAGMIKTFAGRDGGLELSRSADEISLLDVVTTFEGSMMLCECLHTAGGNDCPFDGDCLIRSKWGRIQGEMVREMAATNFADLAAQSQGQVQVEFSVN